MPAAADLGLLGSLVGQPRNNLKIVDNSYKEDEEEQGGTFLGLGGGWGEGYNSDEFWIGCDSCEWWYHGKCVKIAPTKAKITNEIFSVSSVDSSCSEMVRFFNGYIYIYIYIYIDLYGY
ncbi:hypothetical protein J1N35_001535 [Gossypium stocksii]|uniref:PHD finger protein ALFIN-LIKE n=1 Tax=Gossypium stocksii TaxID=47602 RepID=A0A9D4AL59_9ROSI|nr:hypothetical protein J1N35_001535 [Gossypium stocksii]